MIGDLKATFELHNTIILGEDGVSKFEEFCLANKLKPIHVMIMYNNKYKMAEHCNLRNNDFKFDGYTPVILYQTSIYFVGILSEALKKLHSITELLTNSGYQVIREKIEALRSTINEDKLRCSDIIDFSEYYYETHIVVDCEDYNSEVLEELEKFNSIVNADLKIEYVPLSINIKKTDKTQIFISSRKYLSTCTDIKKYVSEYCDMIKKSFNVVKTINETVVYDSNKLVDCQLNY